MRKELVLLGFIDSARKEAARKLGIPPDWWGIYQDVRGPKGQRVFFSSGAWTVSQDGVRVSRHDSRSFAIGKARKLGGGQENLG